MPVSGITVPFLFTLVIGNLITVKHVIFAAEFFFFLRIGNYC